MDHLSCTFNGVFPQFISPTSVGYTFTELSFVLNQKLACWGTSCIDKETHTHANLNAAQALQAQCIWHMYLYTDRLCQVGFLLSMYIKARPERVLHVEATC